MKINYKCFANVSVASVCALLWIWVLPNTLTLRHLLLGVGFISGVLLIKVNWDSWRQLNPRMIPLCLIAGLFVWVGVHYIFFSLNPELELSEIKGLWVRTFAGFIMALGFGTSLHQYQSLRKYFYFSIFAVPILNVGAYLYASYLQGSFLHPNAFIFFIFAKIETAYFGGIAISVAIANLFYLLSNKSDKYHYSLVVLNLFGIALALLSALLSNTKNGIAIGLGLCAFFLVVILIKLVLNFRNMKKIAILIGIFMIGLSSLIWEGHKTFAYKGWDTIIDDVKVSIDINKNTQWQHREGSVVAPLNSLGTPAALNTYSRFSYISVGTRLIHQFPLGYGSVNRSFNGMQDHANIYHEHTGQVHSGWIDFGLSFGLPGLSLIFGALIFIIYFGITQKSELSLIAMMYSLMLIPFGFIAEISYKQYFEATIFFITLASVFIALPSITNKYNLNQSK